jgi:hypothetical protein
MLNDLAMKFGMHSKLFLSILIKWTIFAGVILSVVFGQGDFCLSASNKTLTSGANFSKQDWLDVIKTYETQISEPEGRTLVGLYNLGLAYDHVGDSVNALAAWLAARSRDPKDSETLHHLDALMLREKMTPGLLNLNAHGPMVQLVSRSGRCLVAWSLGFLLFTASVLVGLVYGQLFKGYRLKRYLLICGIMLVAGGSFLRVVSHQSGHWGVVVQSGTTAVRVEPSPYAASTMELIRLTPIYAISDLKSPWVKVLIGNGSEGWIQNQALRVIELP